MAVHKLTPRYLNKDDDERLIKSVEMTDAINIRISTEEDGDAMVLKNAYGNTAIDLSHALPSGTNKVIGSVSDEQLGFIFYFVWNSNDEHSIYRYSIGANQAQRVIRDSVLEFTENGFVKGNIYVNINGDVLLYFNDGLTAPKKINTTKAIVNGYPQLLTGTDEEKLLVLTAAKQPPLDPPYVSLANNNAVNENRIKEKNFQFAYKYIYGDGEHSALSPYSELSISVPQLRDSFSTAGQINYWNQINVSVRNSPADVDKIAVYAREGNEGAFYLVNEVGNTVGTGVKTIKFTNDTLGTALAATDQNKLYDNVPQLADSQEIISGRLMYGGYTEGYDNVDVSQAKVLPNYYDEEPVYNITATVLSGEVQIDYSSLPNNFPDGGKLFINLVYRADEITITDNGGNNLEFARDYYVTSTDEDGDNAKTVGLDEAKDGIKFFMNGVSVKRIIDIPTGSTKQDVSDLVKFKLDGDRYLSLLSPLDGGQSITALTTGGSTLFTNESGDFKGKLEFEIFFSNQFDSSVFRFRFVKAELYLNSFYFGSKKREVVNAEVIKLQNTINNPPYVIDWSNEDLSIGSFVAMENANGYRAFKSGSSHKLGVVYYDDRNRSSGVQELGSVYMSALGSRGSLTNLANGNPAIKGRSTAVVRLKNDPPNWAKRWAPVYTGIGNTELKLMYGVQGAYVPFREDFRLSSFSSSRTIYVSLNQLFDKDGGYVKGEGANVSYTFEKGDRLRIVKFAGNARSNLDFEVIDFVTLLEDDNNPILNKTNEAAISATTGSFLVIKQNPDATNFTRKKIISNESAWFDRCIVEIVKNKKKSDTEIYYEIGTNYTIDNGSHNDDRTSTSVPVSIVTGTTANNVQFTTSVKVFPGDILSSGDYEIYVDYVKDDDSGYYVYGTANSTPTSDTYTVTNPDTVIEIEKGDIYWRLRNLFIENKQPTNWSTQRWQRQNALVEYIEDYSVSDFFDSKSTSIGRPIAYIPDAKKVKRSGSITYSDFDAEDSLRLNLSSFNLSLANFKDTSYEYGSIKYLVGYNDVLYSLQEKRVARLPVSRNIVQTGTGENLVTIDSNVLGQEQYYVGEYGVGRHPESVAFKDGMTYFCDVNAGKVIRIDSQGVTIISDVNMSSYFENKFNDVSRFPSHLVGGGIDSDNDHYLVHSDEVTTSQVLIDDGAYSYDVSLDATGTQVSAQTQYNPSAVFGFSTDPRAFDLTCDFFDSGAEAVVYLDQLSSGAPIYVNIPYQASNLLGVATNSNFDFFVAIRVNMYLPGFSFDNGFCTSDNSGSIDPNSSAIESFTAAYSMGDRVWTTLYSFVPERVDSVHSLMYTFKNGRIYKHDETSDRNSWYGAEAVPSVVEVVSNAEPSSIKTFESISLEGNSPWSATVYTTEQTSTIAESSFNKKEGFYYSYIHGSTSSYGSTISSVSSTSEIFSLGEVSANVINDTDVTFSTNVSTSFPLGITAILYGVSGTTLVSKAVSPVSVNGDTVVFSGNVSATAGDLLVVVGDSAIEGDQIRDYYMKVRVEKTTTEPIELFAVNTIIADSKAHN
jgi:hypothetical protein